jgi:hypothetical protein
MPGFAPGARMVPHVWRAEVVQSAEISVPISKSSNSSTTALLWPAFIKA